MNKGFLLIVDNIVRIFIDRDFLKKLSLYNGTEGYIIEFDSR